MKKPLAIALVGGIAAAMVQRLVPTGWWLNSGRGVILTSLLLALTAAVSAAVTARPLSPPSMLRAAVALWAGANVGFAVVLFAVGPGNLFPIALAFGAGISALAVGAGFLIGLSLLAFWKSTRS